MPQKSEDSKSLATGANARPTVVPYDPSDDNMVPLSLIAFSKYNPAPMDIYLPIAGGPEKKFNMTLICKADDRIEEKWWNLFQRAGVRSVCIKPDDVYLAQEKLAELARAKRGRSTAKYKQEKAAVYQEMAAMSIRAIMQCTQRDREQVDRAADLAKRTMECMVAESEVLDCLQFVVASSNTIFKHSVNVSLMSLVLAHQMGLDRSRTQSIGIGALLHDIGLGKVPSEVLNKPGPLDEDEWRMVKKHPRTGHQILSLSPKIPYDSLNIVLNHHEKPDGTGYPSGLKENSIPMGARLVRVVDMYDAMTSPRPYRKAMSPGKALTMMLEDAKDPGTKMIIAKFLRAQNEVFN